jgi:hypothetical protein
MSESESRFRDALAQIAEVASQAINGHDHSSHDHDDEGYSDDASKDKLVCSPKSLPQRLLVKAAETAAKINPANGVVIASAQAAMGLILTPQHIAVLTAKYWGLHSRRFTVSFMETTPADLRARIVSHMNAWNRTSGMSFVETRANGDVRISRGPGGYWSYLGTDILHIPKNQQTMNLENFTMNTPESEYKRVVRHETGHTLGFPHEHMRKALISRIDPQKAYDFFLTTYGWDKATVDQQVLTSLDERSLMSTAPDQTSIMCYQLPGSITRDGKPIIGGTDINATDAAFAAKLYPKTASSPSTHANAKPSHDASYMAEDWGEANDPEIRV